MRASRLVFAAVLLAAALPVPALQFDAQPPVLHLLGKVQPDDWKVWEEAMRRFEGRLDTVVFHNSPGGHSITGRKIGEDIRKRGLATVVAGRCRSACANMFLGGKERHFSDRLSDHSTVLGYHGSYNRVTKEVNRTKSGDYFIKMTDGKMSEELVERFIRIENKNGFLYMIHPKQRSATGSQLAFLCSGDENTRRFESECAPVEGVDALATGVVTSWEVVRTPKAPVVKTAPITSKNW